MKKFLLSVHYPLSASVALIYKPVNWFAVQIDLLCKSIDWFLYGRSTGTEWVEKQKQKWKMNQFINFLRYLRERSIYHFLPLLTSPQRYYKDKLWDNLTIGNAKCLWAIRKCLCPLLVNLGVSKVWLFLPATHQNSLEHGVW